MRGRRRGSLIIGVSILLIPGERQGIPNGGNLFGQANRLCSCKAALCLHDCRQPLFGREGGGGCAVGAMCRSNEDSRALQAEVLVIAIDRPSRRE